MTLKFLKNLAVLTVATFAASSYGQIVVPESSIRNSARPNAVHTNYAIFKGAWRQSHVNRTIVTRQGGILGYYPADIRAAYSLPSSGGSEAIAIIEAYDYPTALHDFNVFSGQFNLPTESSSNFKANTNQVFQVVYATGTKPAVNASWGGESALDTQWSHAMAPGAKIYLIECASDSFSDILVGIQAAARLPDVREVSMSFGSPESSPETSYDSYFTTPNQVYFAAAGDVSNELDYPAASPNVIGVGGTTLNISGAIVSEVAWADGGGGPSTIEPLPSYQRGFTTLFRGTPDLSADGDPNTGCAVYDSTPIAHQGSGWMVDGGTSLSTPIAAGITNLRGSFSTSSFAELVRQYGLAGAGNFRDIVRGSSGIYSAGTGYDYVTGLGSMINLFPNASYSPASLSVFSGTAIGGIPDNVIKKDGRDYLVRSVSTSGTQQTVNVTGFFSTALPSGASRLGASISIVGMTTSSSTTLSLYNFNTGLWDVISTVALGSSNTPVSVPFSNLSNYFDLSGNVEFQITSQNEGSAPAVFQLGLDQVQLSVTAIN